MEAVNPDGSFRRTARDSPWEVWSHDENDTAAERYDADGALLLRPDAEIEALGLRGHLDTPRCDVLDGRLVGADEHDVRHEHR